MGVGQCVCRNADDPSLEHRPAANVQRVNSHTRHLSDIDLFPIGRLQCRLDDKPILHRNDFQKGFPRSKHGIEVPAVEADDPSTFRGTQFRPDKLGTQRGNSMSEVADLLARRMPLLGDILILVEPQLPASVLQLRDLALHLRD
ncbi:hypothetical protein ACVW0J_001256 [Bradyrhizobium sp. i1.7.7]